MATHDDAIARIRRTFTFRSPEGADVVHREDTFRGCSRRSPSGAYAVSSHAQHGVSDVRVANDPQSKHLARTGNGDVTVKAR